MICLSDYINESAEIFNEQPKKKGFTIGKLFKAILLLFIVLVYAVLFTRCMLSRDHKIVDEVLRDEAFESALLQNPDDFNVQQYPMQSAWVAIRENRLIEFDSLHYVPLAKQMQFSVKYSTDLAGFDYEQDIPFKFRLVNENGEEFTDFWYKSASRSRFGFIRVCFNGVPFEIDGQFDENGKQKRHTYTLYIDMIQQNGEYYELCSYQIYDGSTISKLIDF